MLKAITPKLEELSFRQALLADEETMQYNHQYGGTIEFPEEKWSDWYQRWVDQESGERYFAFLFSEEKNAYIGEIAFYYDESEQAYITNIIVHSKYRGCGYGKEGLMLLCKAAEERGITALCDNIAVDNPSINLFMKLGFHEIWRNQEVVMVKKEL